MIVLHPEIRDYPVCIVTKQRNVLLKNRGSISKRGADIFLFTAFRDLCGHPGFLASGYAVPIFPGIKRLELSPRTFIYAKVKNTWTYNSTSSRIYVNIFILFASLI
jgi:hypothetical protein